MYSKNKLFPKHGGDIQGFAKLAGCLPEQIIDFSSNINPLGLSKKLQSTYQASVSDLIHYPDARAQKMCEMVARKHQLDESHVLAGNGSIALIDLVIRCLCPKKALLIEPCFNEYRRLLSLANVDIEHVQLKPDNDFQFPFEEILKKISEIDLLIVGHPNNPTGSALSAEKLIRLMDEAEQHGKFILIDEAFVDWFEEESVIRHVYRYSSVIVVRSLTKFYSLAGIRVGYACAQKEMIDRMRTFQETWSCNSIAQKLAMAALLDYEFQTKSRKWFEEEKISLFESLRGISFIQVFPTKANFFLCQIIKPEIIKIFWQSMRRSGIYLREVDDFIGLNKSYFRVALKLRKENLYFVNELKAILKGQQSIYDGNIFSVHS